MKYFIERVDDEQALYNALTDIMRQDSDIILLIDSKRFKEDQKLIEQYCKTLGIPYEYFSDTKFSTATEIEIKERSWRLKLSELTEKYTA